MASKYASLKNKLPAFEEESSYQQKVNDEKQLILGAENTEAASVAFLAAKMERWKARKDEIEEELYGANLALEALSQMLVDAMEEEGLEKFTLQTGSTVYIGLRPYLKLEDREALFEWIKKNKMQSVLSVNHQTLQGMVNEEVVKRGAAGKPLNPVFPGVSCTLKSSAKLLRKGADE